MFSKVLVVIASIILAPLVLETRVRYDHVLNDVASSTFKFRNIPSPIKDDAASRAKLTLIDGEIDPASNDLSALVDGRLPRDEDEPGANFFFNAGTFGGRFSMDFANPIIVQQINSYSWHANSRGPQLYKVYGAVGSESNFNGSPKRGVDPIQVGWHYIATVSTIPEQGDDGGQYGVSISNENGPIGTYRYLLFDCYATELNDDWGNTFYSEVDVVSPPARK